MKKVLTTCPYCGAGCGFYLNVEGGELVGVTPSLNHPVSQGRLCVKGWNAHEPVGHQDRLRTPLVRRNGGLVEASWEEALDLVAERFAAIRKREGGQALGLFSSARCTNEENYLAQKLARAVFGTNNVDHCARTCHSPSVAGLRMAFGSGAMTNSIDEIASAPCIFAIGCNAPEAHPLIGWRVRTAKDRGAVLIVADPRRTDLACWADIHLQHYPGTDIPLLNAMMNVMVRDGSQDRAFIEARTEGFWAMWEVVERYPPEVAAPICGVEAEEIVEAARSIAKAERMSIIYTLGITEHTTGTENVMSVANLAMLTGNVGKPFSGVNPLRGQNNVQGACDMGALPDLFPGYQPVDDPAAREKFERAWKVELSSQPGLTSTDMLEAAADGSLRALYVIGEDPLRSEPNTARVQRALENLDFLVCQEIFMNETCKLADVVLPGASYAEKDGTFTNSERRIQRVRQAIPPLTGAKPDWEIIAAISARMGYALTVGGPAEILGEIASLTPIYAGISFERLEGFGIQWPCPDKSHPGTPTLHVGRFARGLGKFHAIEHRPPAEVPDEHYPLILSTGRMLYHYNVGTMTRRTAVLAREFPSNFVQINPLDAEPLGIRPNAPVRVLTRRGELTVRAEVTDSIRPGVVWMPFHFAESPTNALTKDAFCPISRIGEYKACAARVESLLQ